MADFEENLSRFTERGVDVIAASSETIDEAKNTVAKSDLHYPVGYGINPKEFASRFGAYYSNDSTYLHATGFLLDPEGKVDISVYSCGAIGRFTASDALQILEYRLNSDS